MKNKEIEELLNDLKKTADTSFFAVCGSEEELKKMPRGVCKFLLLNDKQAKLLLSHIEQLENNRDNALREIIYMIENGNIEFFKGKKLENILMGDSDENIRY